MSVHVLGELIEVADGRPIPPGFVILNEVNLGATPPVGIVPLRRLLYVGDAAQVVAAALEWERNAERTECAQIADDHDTGGECGGIARDIASAIRARAAQP